MKHALLIAFALICAGVSAQDTIRWSSQAVTKAVWEQPQSPAVPFGFSARIDVHVQKQLVGRVHHLHLGTTAQWLKSESFLADSIEERMKPLAQLYFDCYELESRILQETINLRESDLFEELKEAEDNAKIRIAGLRILTEDGRNTTELNRWRKWMDSTLLATPRLYPPNFGQGIFSLGFDLGIGAAFYNGHLTNYFGTAAGWGFGAGFGLKRFLFDYRMLYCYPQAKQAFGVADFTFSDTNRLRLDQSSWSIGWQVIRRRRISIAPYVALSTFRVINRDVPEGSLYAKGRVSLNAEGGVLAEWRFFHFYQTNEAQFFWKLIFRAGYAPVNYLNSVDGGALKVQVGIGWSLRSVVNERFAY